MLGTPKPREFLQAPVISRATRAILDGRALLSRVRSAWGGVFRSVCLAISADRFMS